MPSVVSTPSSSRMATHAVSQADLDVLALLTSDESSLGPLPTRPTQKHSGKRIARRDSPMDALLISAVLSGSDPLTRHHFGHGAGEAIPGIRGHTLHDRADLSQLVKAHTRLAMTRDPRLLRIRCLRPKLHSEACRHHGVSVSRWSNRKPK